MKFHVLHFHVLHFHVLQFHAVQLGPSFLCPAISCPAIWSVIFMSCNFMPWYLVRHFHVLQFHVRHFQRPRCGLCAPASCVYFSFNTSVLIPHSVPITIASCLRACLGHHNVPLSSHESNSQETPGMSFLTTIFVLCNDLRRRFIEDNGHHSFCIRIYLFYRIY